MKTEVVYKAVTVLDDRLVSWASWDDDMVEYAIGRVSKAPRAPRDLGYDLLAFETLESVEGFTNEYGSSRDHGSSYRIYKARATGVKRTLPPILHYAPHTEMDLEDVYRPSADSPAHGESGWPLDTVMCSTIELIEEVLL